MSHTDYSVLDSTALLAHFPQLIGGAYATYNAQRHPHAQTVC